MPLTGDYNLFRRLVGDDITSPTLTNVVIEAFLDDAAKERSAQDIGLTLTAVFDTIPDTRKPEVIYQAAINHWWNIAARLMDKHTQTVGQSSQNVGEKFDRAMEMIQRLQTKLDNLLNSAGNNDVIMANNSRFSKVTLTRLGGVEEEDILNG